MKKTNIDNKTSEAKAPQTKLAQATSFITTLVVIILIASVIRGAIFEPYKIPSESMVPTLQIGDHIIVTKFDFGFRLPFIKKAIYNYASPKRGEIIVFTRPDEPLTIEDESSINLIKRVVGLPGETIEVRDAQVFINGKKLNEDYAVWLNGGNEDYAPRKIPEGHVVMLGDNRDHSKDSRYWADPFLPIKLIKGRARFVFFSWKNPSRIGTIFKKDVKYND